MKKILFLLVVIISSLSSAQTPYELFKTANSLYKEGKYKEAINIYQKIKETDQISSELYYNLGNSYYKLNKVAATIYNYEKALQLNPLNKDAKNNLTFAKKLTLDAIEKLPKTFLQKIEENYLQKLSYNQWAIVVVVFSFLASLLFLLFYFAETPSKKRLYFTTSILLFILLISAVSITFKEYHFSKNNRHAIVFAKKTAIKNAPTLNSDNVFSLHEGTRVTILDEVDNWKKIKLADGKIGWMLSNELKEI